jgi:hypothetical protein
MATMDALLNVAQRLEVAGGEDRLQVRLAAGFAHGADLVVKRLPVLPEHMGAGDDDVDLARALAHRPADFLQLSGSGIRPGGKAGGHRGDRDARALQRLYRMGHHGRVDADRADARHVIEAERLAQVAGGSAACLGAQPATRAGVSSPASVVRSMQVIALTSHAACQFFLTVRRVVSVAARRSTADRLTRAPSIHSTRSGVPSLRGRLATGRGPAWGRLDGAGIQRL